ncbi:MAG: hypothetical protein ACYC25_00445 [Paludibacter sp.]
MDVITKDDLFYKDYSWTVYSKDNPKVTGHPDSTLLNRKEGYEILYFVNKYCEIKGYSLKSSAIKVEKMIRNEVPEGIHSQIKIKEWIETHWSISKY